MTLDDYRDSWDSQPCGEIVARGKTIVEENERRLRRSTTCMLLFFTINLISIVHFFWASYVVRQEGMLIATIRCSLFIVIAAVQWMVWRSLRRETARREACVLDQKQCLGLLLTDLNKETRQLSPLFAIPPTALAVGFIFLMKWIDFRLGHDSAAECIAIAAFSVAVIGVIPVGMWHYQQQFVIPRRDRVESILASLEGE